MAGRRKAFWLGIILLGMVLLAVLPHVIPWRGGSLPPAEEADVDVTPRQLDPIPPGTVIEDRPPEEWTHLVVKSCPRVADESIDKVSESTARLAGLLFTAIVADVKEEPQARQASRFSLSKVAAGVGTEVDGQDVVLSSDTQKELGADLGLLDRTALAGGEAHVQEICCVARSRTMLILDAPNVLLHEDKHRLVVLRYAILVDPKTGRLDTLLWLLELEDGGAYLGPVGPMQWLPPSKLVDCLLHVDRDEFILGVPTTKGFAMVQIPQGRQTLAFSQELKSTAAQSRLTRASARELERQLRSLISQEPGSK